MLAQVVADLRHFMIMYAICVGLFSLVITTLQNSPSEYYLYMGPFMGNVIDTFKISLGDFEVIGRVTDD
jgi:hypothetical protein